MNEWKWDQIPGNMRIQYTLSFWNIFEKQQVGFSAAMITINGN